MEIFRRVYATRQGSGASRSFAGAIGGELTRTGRVLDSKSLCAQARRNTALESFGEPSVEPALTFLLNSLEGEADLHPFGRFLMMMHLREILEARLRLNREWNETVRDSERTPVFRPIFITGMPRSGSTFLHELLAQAPTLRAPRVWEVMSPVSAGQPDRGWTDRRVWSAAICLWWFRRFAPKADAVYPMRARTPQECVAIHSYTLLSEEFVATCHAPTYEKFLRSTDLRPAYAWEKRFLQHLQTGHSGTQWLLKSPDHTFGLEALFSIFPDALVVQTHRDPLDALRSLIQLSEVLKGLYGRPPDRDELARHEAQNLAESLSRIMQYRDKHPELRNRFIDVNYSELVAAPLTVVRRIFHRFEIPLSDATDARMQLLASSRSSYRGRNTAPTLLEASLGARPQLNLFKDYCHRFGLSLGLSRVN